MEMNYTQHRNFTYMVYCYLPRCTSVPHKLRSAERLNRYTRLGYGHNVVIKTVPKTSSSPRDTEELIPGLVRMFLSVNFYLCPHNPVRLLIFPFLHLRSSIFIPFYNPHKMDHDLNPLLSYCSK